MASSKTVLVNGGYPLHTFEDVENLYIRYISSPSDRQMIRDAYEFILKKHEGQFRKSGEPYYHHLIEVAYIVAELHAGPSTIAGALLHDVVEDTDVTIEEIEQRWGKDIAKIVDALTKIQRLKLSKITSEEFEAEDHRKILIGMAKDIRVIIIKLADRLHNLRTLASLSPERQKAISQETLDVFIPIAHRLGLDVIKSEMSDLCLKYLEPEIYHQIEVAVKKKFRTLSKSLEAIKKRIADILFEHNIPFDISSRVKSIFSIYEKIYKKGHTFDDVYDILALRIITETEMQCYEILGLIHATYKPVPGRFKDYIAMPKPNMYQSLHTTIVSGSGNIYEIQIRTKEMDEVAETGIASHWAYKEGNGYNAANEQKEIENKLHWFRDFVSMTGSNHDAKAKEYIDSLTRDIFEANVYVFTPKGRVIELPAGSTPIDFAYRIHSKIGQNMVGAIVNGIMVPLNTVLVTGDVVEIKTSKNAPGPNEGWLEYVKTNTAKSFIKKYIAKKNEAMLREEKIAKGHQSLVDAFEDREVDEEEMIRLISDPKVLEHFEVNDVDELYINVSGRKPTAAAVIDFLNIKKPVNLTSNISTVRVQGNKNTCPVEVKGASGIAISLARCCTPLPGDDIIGYVSKGKGITVHRITCPNIAHEKDRLVEVRWRKDIEFAAYPVDLLLEANDRPNLLINVMTLLTNSHVPVSNLHANKTNNDTTCLITLTIMVSDAKRVNDISNILLNISGVYKVNRIIH